ncbi:uncharacterized protein N7496_009315 [Penicillium cataractarum]|uniref:Uncharacterized protein n=1 Tax=Penicillium cataractarum TaxID=2100454 RepID=A0A9W9RNX5_9EURO|nr:uncharacterized protein N7496_009315 [Penicillium cataractarum]KAJ5363602.1 hypothetical protein N7496_009315 [Penicillium cataractarum]
MLSGGDLDLQLALTLLLALFEWESGSVEACFMHITGADALSLTSHDQISKTSSGLRLLGSWAEMRTQKNGHKLPFRPLDEELIGDRTTQTMILSKRIAGHSIPSLSFLLTEAYCLRNRLVLQSCMNLNGIDSESTLRICRAWYSRAFDFTFEEYPETEVHSTLSLEDLLFRLSTTRWLLEEWRAALPAKALPSPLQTSVIYTLRPTRLHPAPVLQLTRFIFQECGAAIQFLRYQIGCFLSSRDILDSYLTRSRPPLPNEPLGPEATLILSIIESLDPSEDSLHYTFDEGILWILNVLPVCIPDIRVTSYLLDIILPRLEHYGSFKPLLFDLKTRQMLVGIHSEIEAGRLPLLYDPNVLITDDIALNNNRLGSKAAVLGRTLEGGSFQDVVELPPVAVSRGTFIQ